MENKLAATGGGSMFSVRLLKPMPLSSRLVKVVMRWGRKRPKESL
jgi:hypothetical protein